MTADLTQVSDNFSRAAERYDALAVHQNGWMRKGLQWALDAFPQKAEVLDIGCGTGLFAEEAKKLRDWRITGLDIAPGMLAIAATRCAKVIEAGVESIPCKDATFDAVFSSLALQWVSDKGRAFREIARILKPGGAAVIVTLGSENLKELHSVAGKGSMELLAMEHAERYEGFAKTAGLTVTASESKSERITYASTREMLGAMRNIGAGNAGTPPSRQQVNMLIAEYDRLYVVPEGVYATWQPVYLSLKKP